MEALIHEICELARPTNRKGFRRYLKSLTYEQLAAKHADLKADEERRPALREPVYAGIRFGGRGLDQEFCRRRMTPVMDSKHNQAAARCIQPRKEQQQ